MSTGIDEKLKRIADQAERRRESASADILARSEKLVRLEVQRGLPEREAESAHRPQPQGRAEAPGRVF
jgi:hypothetical protein